MKAVAYIELVIFIRLVLGAVALQNSLLSPIIYGHFLRQRYYQSPFTRDAVAYCTAQIDKLVRRQGNPALINAWVKAQMLVGRWAGTTLTPQQPTEGAAPRD
jgi:hypothetical protein